LVVLTKLDDTIELKQNTRKIARTHNIGLAIWRLKRFYETFSAESEQVVQGSKLGILMIKIPHIAKPCPCATRIKQTARLSRML